MKQRKLKSRKPLWPLQSQCMTFYGDPRKPGWLHDNTTDVPVPWQLIYEGKPIASHILIHKRCADSLARVLQAIWNGVHQDPHEISRRHYDHYSGSYNFRVMRGGHALSMHSYACAIDFYDEANEFHQRPKTKSGFPIELWCTKV